MHEFVRRNSRRLRRKGHFLSPAARICRADIHGQTVFFTVKNPRDEIQKHHAAGHFYEGEELAILARHFPVGGVFCDIGANVGNHALYVAKYLHAGRIVLFEPNPDAIEILESNILLNRIESVCDRQFLGYGLSDGSADSGSIRAPKANLGYGRITEGEGEIPLASADSLLGETRFDLIKIDVEGLEMQVLSGMQELVDATRPKIFIEVDNANADAFAAWMKANDYHALESFQRYKANTNHLVAAR